MRCGPPARRSRAGRSAPGTTAARSCTASPRCWKTGPVLSSRLSPQVAHRDERREPRWPPRSTVCVVRRMVRQVRPDLRQPQPGGRSLLQPLRTRAGRCGRGGGTRGAGPARTGEPGGASLVPGNALVVLASESQPLPAVAFTEVLATSDVPGGVVNLLTGPKSELLPVLCSHMDVQAVDLAAPTTRWWGPGGTGGGERQANRRGRRLSPPLPSRPSQARPGTLASADADGRRTETEDVTATRRKTVTEDGSESQAESSPSPGGGP